MNDWPALKQSVEGFAKVIDIKQKERLADETVAYLAELAEHDIMPGDLVSVSPGAWQDRERAKRIALQLSNSAALLNVLLEQRSLPISLMVSAFGVPVGFVERYADYITALTVLANGDYPALRDYLNPWRWTVGYGKD
ncbi:MAG: hypothetical protein ACM3QZ_07220 [Solirubrobacterales bacterium]